MMRLGFFLESRLLQGWSPGSPTPAAPTPHPLTQPDPGQKRQNLP